MENIKSLLLLLEELSYYCTYIISGTVLFTHDLITLLFESNKKTCCYGTCFLNKVYLIRLKNINDLQIVIIHRKGGRDNFPAPTAAAG